MWLVLIDFSIALIIECLTTKANFFSINKLCLQSRCPIKNLGIKSKFYGENFYHSYINSRVFRKRGRFRIFHFFFNSNPWFLLRKKNIIISLCSKRLKDDQVNLFLIKASEKLNFLNKTRHLFQARFRLNSLRLSTIKIYTYIPTYTNLKQYRNQNTKLRN